MHRRYTEDTQIVLSKYDVGIMQILNRYCAINFGKPNHSSVFDANPEQVLHNKFWKTESFQRLFYHRLHRSHTYGTDFR